MSSELLAMAKRADAFLEKLKPLVTFDLGNFATLDDDKDQAALRHAMQVCRWRGTVGG